MNPKTKRNIFIGAGALVLLWLSNMAKAGVNSLTNLKANIPGLVIGGENQGAKIKLADLKEVSDYNATLRFKNSTTKQQAIYYNNEYAPIVWSSSQVNSAPNSNQFWNDYYLYDSAGGSMINAPKTIGEVVSSKEMIWAFGNDGTMVNLIKATLILIKADNGIKFENPSLFPNNTFYIILFPNDKTYKLT